MAIACDDVPEVTLVNWRNGTELLRISMAEKATLLSFSPSGTELIVVNSPRLSAYSVATGANVATVGKIGDDFLDMQVLADGKRLLVAEGERGLALRSFPDLQVLARVLDHSEGVKGVAVSPDAQNFAAVDNENNLRILDGRTLQPLMILKDDNSLVPLHMLRFAPSGDYLVGVQDDRLVFWFGGLNTP